MAPSQTGKMFNIPAKNLWSSQQITLNVSFQQILLLLSHIRDPCFILTQTKNQNLLQKHWWLSYKRRVGCVSLTSPLGSPSQIQQPHFQLKGSTFLLCPSFIAHGTTCSTFSTVFSWYSNMSHECCCQLEGEKGKEWTRSLPFSNCKLMWINWVNLPLPLGSQEILDPVVWILSHTITYLGQTQIQELPIFQFWLRNCLHSMSFWSEISEISQKELLS